MRRRFRKVPILCLQGILYPVGGLLFIKSYQSKREEVMSDNVDVVRELLAALVPLLPGPGGEIPPGYSTVNM